jgi:hypothetical protein
MQWRAWSIRTGSCESGNRPAAHDNATGYTYHGAMQFHLGTWASARGHMPERIRARLPADPHNATLKGQRIVAIDLARREGTQHWPRCG